MSMRYFGLIIVLLFSYPVQAGVGGQLRQAGKLYANEQYGQALATYEQALQKDPKNAQATFGAGAAAYHLKEYQQAQEAFENVSHENSPLGHDALFNLGNTYYRAGQKEQAISAYRQAIMQNRQDKEAIHNLQLVLQQEQNQNNKNDQNNQNQDKNSKNNDQQEQQNNQGQAPQQEQQNQDQQPQQPQNQQNQLDKQSAERVMQLARDNEYKRPTQHGPGTVDESVEKDW